MPSQQQASCIPDAAAVDGTSDTSASMAAEQDDLLEREGFDAAELYAAVKPSGKEPQLPQDNPKLRPTLRPYQRRAAAWMVARETGALVCPPMAGSSSFVWYSMNAQHPMQAQVQQAFSSTSTGNCAVVRG